MSYNEELESRNAALRAILEKILLLPSDAVRYGLSQELTAVQKAQARTNIGAVAAAGLTLGYGADGLLYIFADGVAIGNGIELPTGGIDGYITEDKQIVFNNLPDGEYTLAYIADDGTVIPIGSMEKDTNVYYSVTNTLTNCVSSNSATRVAEGASYEATITAKSGYKLESVVVTMGGEAVTVSGGAISIAAVTGDIVVTAVAESAVSGPTNFVEYNATNTEDWSIWINKARIGSDGAYRSDESTSGGSNTAVSNWVPVQKGDIISFGGFYAAPKSTGAYTDDKALVAAAAITSLTSVFSDIDMSTNNTTYTGQFTISSADVGYIRIGGYVKGNIGDPYINIMRNGEWL